MKRQKTITLITEENASPEAKAAIEKYVTAGSRLTNMRSTLLNSVESFTALEDAIGIVAKKLIEKLSARTVLFYNYAIANGNSCLVCSNFFKRIVLESGIENLDEFEFTEEEQDLIAYAGALTEDPNHVPDEIYEKLQARYDEETLVLVVTHGLLTMVSNYFNNIVGVELDEYLLPYLDK